MHSISRLLAVLAAILWVSAAWAGNDGTYVLEGGSYSIDVKFGPGTLTVVEPNKTSVYRQQGSSNDYAFTNPTNNITYGLRVVDASTLQAYKPGTNSPPSTLRLRAPGPMSSVAASGSAEQIAERYAELSESDPANAQTWAQCAAAAMVRAMLPADQANAAVMQSAMLLKMITVNKASSPCPDAIPEALWRAAPTG